jgi:hypothetical protein
MTNLERDRDLSRSLGGLGSILGSDVDLLCHPRQVAISLWAFISYFPCTRLDKVEPLNLRD